MINLLQFFNISWWRKLLSLFFLKKRKFFFFGILIVGSFENKIEILSGINIYFKLRVCKIPSKPTWLNIFVLWPTSQLPTLLFPPVQVIFLTNPPSKNISNLNQFVLLLINLLPKPTLSLWLVSFRIVNFQLIW